LVGGAVSFQRSAFSFQERQITRWFEWIEGVCFVGPLYSEIDEMWQLQPRRETIAAVSSVFLADRFSPRDFGAL